MTGEGTRRADGASSAARGGALGGPALSRRAAPQDASTAAGITGKGTWALPLSNGPLWMRKSSALGDKTRTDHRPSDLRFHAGLSPFLSRVQSFSPRFASLPAGGAVTGTRSAPIGAAPIR